MKICYYVLMLSFSMMQFLHCSEMSIDPEIFSLSLRHGLANRALSRADFAVGKSVSVVTSGALHILKFCRDYPRLALIIVLIAPLLSDTCRTFLVQMLKDGTAYITTKLWEYINARLFGAVNRDLNNVQAGLALQQSAHSELQNQIKKLEGLLNGHSEQLNSVQEQEQEISRQIGAANVLLEGQSAQFCDLKSQQTFMGEQMGEVKDSLTALQQELGLKHRDLVALVEGRFAALPEAQRIMLAEYMGRTDQRFDQLNNNVNEIMRTLVLQNKDKNVSPDCSVKRPR